MKGFKSWWNQLVDDYQYFSDKVRNLNFNKIRERATTTSAPETKVHPQNFDYLADDSDILPTPTMSPMSGSGYTNTPKGLPGSEFTSNIL
ncbi:hypothetical protein [Vibrio cholerae]|uniref:hypothetical protein n=1 Tax=Vibrio cholerae TaxID=666 RepID=UPI0030802081